MELQDLKKSISELSDDEIRAALLGIRSSRRTPKKPPASAKKAAAKADKATPESSADISTLIKMLSKDDLAKLLSSLGGKK